MVFETSHLMSDNQTGDIKKGFLGIPMAPNLNSCSQCLHTSKYTFQEKKMSKTAHCRMFKEIDLQI